ncbi:hypothetical protein EDB81DRAFT_81457 [Dactylonectria macrodidyma]|uniref:Secreted protein n=1 Tax=Dactylonectria macrodidyma TaxID=307937 RepID=A0A9P9EH69_9HYPO|nr:hypothetical protein EDB81DRAFT_81457 [Dactylonectria macrodidyma]
MAVMQSLIWTLCVLSSPRCSQAATIPARCPLVSSAQGEGKGQQELNVRSRRPREPPSPYWEMLALLKHPAGFHFRKQPAHPKTAMRDRRVARVI